MGGHRVEIDHVLVEEPARMTEPVPLDHPLVAARHVGIVPHDPGPHGLLIIVGVEEIVPAADREGPDRGPHSVAHIRMALQKEVRPGRTAAEARHRIWLYYYLYLGLSEIKTELISRHHPALMSG